MMKIVSWALGLSLGAAMGALIVALFVPLTAEEIIRRLKSGYNDALYEAHLASQERRIELEAELAQMQGKPRIASSQQQLPPPNA